MADIPNDLSLLANAAGRTVLITGGANGIGAATASLFNAHGSKVVISDLGSTKPTAETLIQTFSHPENAVFIPANILDWVQMTALFKEATRHFGAVDIVIANAGVMESHAVLDLDDIDEAGDLRESAEGFKVIDINLKGTLNTLRLAMHHMKPRQTGSIVLLASTSGYFGGTGVTAYVASKHGIVGLLRASQSKAQQHGIRVNAIAPFLTPTRITAGFAQQWQDAGLEANTPARVAEAIAQAALDATRRGSCVMVAGKFTREMEATRSKLLPLWLGEDVAAFMGRAMRFFVDIGGPSKDPESIPLRSDIVCTRGIVPPPPHPLARLTAEASPQCPAIRRRPALPRPECAASCPASTMGIASIDIDHADNESGPHVHGSISLQSLVPAAHGGAYVETGDGDWTPGVREWLVTVCVSILVTMDAFNATVVIPLIPDLSSTLVQPLENTLWLNTAYLLASAASQALLTMLAEGLGHGPVLLAAVVLATVGTGVCGGSPGLPGLVAGRFIQGMGGGAITSVSLLVVAETIPKTHQARFTGYVFRAQVAGTVAGPLLGALFVQHAGGIWVFYSSFVFCALGMLVVPFAVDLRGYGPGYRGVSMRTLRAGDWVGGMLVFLSLGSLVSGVSWGGTQFAWDGWQTLVPICVGAVLGVLLLVYAAVRMRTNVVYNPAVLRSMSVTMLHAGVFFHGVMISTHLQFLPLYLLLVQGLPATLVGLSATALTALTPFFLLLLEKTPVFTSHPRIAPWLIRAGWTIDILSTGCCVLLDEATPTAAWVFVFLVAGVSHALLLPSYVVALQHVVPQYSPHRGGAHRSRKADAPSALMAHSLLRTWGMCVAVSVGGCVFMNWVARSAGVHDGLVDHSATEMRALRPWGEADMTIVERGVYVDGLRMLWKVFTAVAGVGGLSSVFI
ncbi:MFS multidrug transporter [Aspergillus terreus]|uniref:MFS multidrug transporter n=1 Tax=Aspergillus terreus TaxID=33178 RepID=A0A5M3Z7R8_ASPTE|nr:hypothetical protein ATETN484_0011018800 [Aspergillus terreus]GFF18825.1 MFS multidrug transporter [Aspergillus terreus]